MTEQAFPGDTMPSGDGSSLEVAEPVLEDWQRDLYGLLEVGHLEGSFSFCGHKIVIRTLNTDEELIAAGLIKEWEATVAGTKAYATALTALSVLSIDGQPLPVPVGETGSKHQWAVERFRWAGKLYPWTIDAVYNSYLELEARVKQVLDRLGKASDPAEGAIPGSSTSPAPLSAEGS